MIEVYIGGRSLASTRKRPASDPMDLSSEGPVLWIIAGWTYLSLQDDCSSVPSDWTKRDNGARHTDTPSWKIDWLSSMRKRSINKSSRWFWIPVPFFSSIADHFSMVSTPQTIGVLQAVSGDFLGLQSDSNLVEVLRPTMAHHGPPKMNKSITVLNQGFLHDIWHWRIFHRPRDELNEHWTSI